jgi:hypothetical protein
MNTPVSIACESGPIAAGALSVLITFFEISIEFSLSYSVLKQVV